MRKQYHFRRSRNGYYAWDIDRLILLSKSIKIKEVSLNVIKELDEDFWYGSEGDIATCRSIVGHMRLIHEADLSYPIILSSENRVMDGMHRVCKALYEGNERIKVVQFEKTPKPDYEDVYPDELSYE